MTAQQYWHGGARGLRVGEQILPPSVTGTTKGLQAHAEKLGASGEVLRRDVVYITTDRGVARGFAAFYPDGALYRVTPAEPLEPDPDCGLDGLSWRCPSATVAAVVDPVVLLRSRSMEAWMRILNGGAR